MVLVTAVYTILMVFEEAFVNLTVVFVVKALMNNLFDEVIRIALARALLLGRSGGRRGRRRGRRRSGSLLRRLGELVKVATFVSVLAAAQHPATELVILIADLLHVVIIVVALAWAFVVGAFADGGGRIGVLRGLCGVCDDEEKGKSDKDNGGLHFFS